MLKSDHRFSYLHSPLQQWADENLLQPLLKAHLNIGSDDLEAGELRPMHVLSTETDSPKSPPRGSCARLIWRLDEIDKHYSRMLQEKSSLAIELVLFLFAHFFNRGFATISILMSGLVGAYRYDIMLYQLGFRPVNHEISPIEQLRYGAVFMVYYAVSLLVMVCSTQILKYSFRRQRPKNLPYTNRIRNLRNKEDGTFSMPSGDSAAAALFCYQYCTMMGLPAIYMILPLVCLGRVYYQCHWIGDTIAGSIVGTFWGALAVSQFNLSIPVQQFIVGPDTFLP